MAAAYFLAGKPFIFLLPPAIKPPLIPTSVSPPGTPVVYSFQLSNVSWSLGFEAVAELA